MTRYPGIWFFWSSTWVEFSGEYGNGKATVTFGNNKGWWYDPQLFYKAPEAKTGGTYEITLTITSPAAGKVTICGTEVQLTQGTADYTITTTQAGGKATVVIIFGVVDKNDGQQEIQDGTVSIAVKSVTETAAPQPGTGGNDGPNAADYNEGQTFDATYTSMVNGEEATMTADTWTYWYVANTQWDCGPVVDLSVHTLENGVMTFTWQGGDRNWCMQLFYKNSALTDGKVYKLNCKINSSDARKVKINDKEFDLKAGDNNIEVLFTLGGELSSFDAQLNQADTAATVKISDVKWTEMIEKQGTQVEYEEGQSYNAAYTVFENGDEPAANNNKDTWRYWYVAGADWGCGSLVTMSTNTIENSVITLTYSGGSVDYCVQLFYKNSALTNGKVYKLTCKINASAAHSVKINGKGYNLAVGDNTIEVTYTRTDYVDYTSICDFDAQFNAAASGVTLKISEVKWTEMIEKQSGSSQENGGNEQPGNAQHGGYSPALANVSLQFIEKYGNDEYFFFVATSPNLDLTTVSKISVNGKDLEWKEVTLQGDGTYALKIKCDTTQEVYEFGFFVGNTLAAKATYKFDKE